MAKLWFCLKCVIVLLLHGLLSQDTLFLAMWPHSHGSAVNFVSKITDRNGRQNYENKTQVIERQQCVPGFLLISPTKVVCIEKRRDLNICGTSMVKQCNLNTPPHHDTLKDLPERYDSNQHRSS